MRKRGSKRGRRWMMAGRHGQAGGPGQFRQLLHGVFRRGAVGAGDADEDGPLPAPALPAPPPPGPILLPGRPPGRRNRGPRLPGCAGIDDGPVVPVQRLGQEVGHLDGPGQAVGDRERGRHRVQAQQGQVHQVVLGQGAGVQVGVDEPQALEAALGAPLPGQRRNHQALGVPHEDVGDQALAVQQHPHLAVQVLGDFGQLPGQLRGQQICRRAPCGGRAALTADIDGTLIP